jgi:methyl halide transferase
MENTTSINELQHPRWNTMWEKGIDPGQAFDTGVVGPCLLNEIKNNRVPQGRALVPGCGRGYDCIALASSSRFVLGIDLAQKAVDAANALKESASGTASCTNPENVTFQVQDFFSLPTESTTDKFSFIYDYTFLCAIDPSIRLQWITKMSELVLKDGILLTLIFPICNKDGGPPFAMSLDIVEDLLMSNEQKGKWEKLQLEILPVELSHEGRGGQAGGFNVSSAPAGSVAFEAYSGIGRWKRL